MLRLGGVASASYLTVFQGLGEMSKREGIDMDWVLSGIPQIKPTFLDIAPGRIPPNIIPYSKGVKCGLMRPDSLKVPAFIGQPLCCQA